VRNYPIFRIPRLYLIIAISLFFSQTKLHSQTVAPQSKSLEPGPKPADVSLKWKQLVGIYSHLRESTVIILERDQKLFWLQDKRESAISVKTGGNNQFLLSDRRDFKAERDSSGIVRQITVSGEQLTLIRTDAGSDPKNFFHVTAAKHLDDLRAEALRASPPDEMGPFRRPDLVELTSLDPSIRLDIRYAQSDNFLSTPVYSQARAFMQRHAAEALVRVLEKLQPLGYGLLIHDAYRPWYVTKIFWDATPAEGHIFVADPQKGSKHNRGCAVDLTLYDISTGQPVEMPGLYDEMSQRSFPNFPGGTSLERWHRDLLRRAMESEGFTVNEDEWWHFDYKDWKRYPILNVPFEKLGLG
jgi:D-alanyl-D-alanine dipeptidase